MKLSSGAIILTAFLSFSCFAYSQTSWRTEKLGVQDGLSEGNIYVIHQDRNGFIWIGTHGGLNRYDGYGFRVFQYTPFNASTLGDNAVFFLKEDSTTGKFWIGGSSCLNEFDPQTFINTRYRYAKKQLEFADGIFINPHQMLLACEHEVLLFNTLDKSFHEIPVFDEHDKPVLISRVENLATDKKGNYLIMSRTGVFFYDTSVRMCKRKTNDSPDFSAFNRMEIFNVIQDSRGFYWLATNKNGLIRFEPSTGVMKTVTLPAPFKNESLRFDVIREDAKGNIWSGSSNGLFRTDPVTLATEYFSSDVNRSAHLSQPEVNVITEDRNHFLWIGTVGNGINKMIPRTSGFRNYNLVKTGNEQQIGSYIMAIQELGDDIWFANIWDQIGKVNRENGSTSMPGSRMFPAGYSWYSEGSIVKNKSGGLSVLNGEYRYDITESKEGRVAVQSTISPGLTHIFHDSNGRTWYFVKAAVEKMFQRNDTIYGNCFFYDAKEDNLGNIWIGSSSGLIKFDTHQNQFAQFRHDDNSSKGISSDFVYSLELDNTQEYVWLAAYNGGLCSYHIPSETFRHYRKEDGLSDNIVYSIEKDHHGNLWFSSNAGISTYNAKAGTFRNFGVADGLLNSEFNRRASYKDKDGWLFFGGISGIDYFHPDSIIKNSSSAHLSFTGFKLFNKDYFPSRKNGVPVIELKYNDHYVHIEFASLSYNDQQKTQYAYRINNNDWINTGNQHMISFSELPTGSHNLYVRSTSNEGVWLNNQINCIIVVHPAWWQTGWFKWGLGVLLLGMLAGGIRFYYRRKLEGQKIILEKQQAIERERTRIATDMHDDLGAGLSRIRFLSETIGIKRQRQEDTEEEIRSIRNYSGEMIDKMGEIVWALNEKNDSLSDLLSYTRSYAVEYLSQNGIGCKVIIPEQIPEHYVTGEFRRNMYLSVKEALHNIVKHAQANQVLLTIETGRDITISIQDNGIGYTGNHQPYSNGISNMKQRMKNINGIFSIENNNGTMIRLSAPLSS